jgi:hypothetical protein
MAGPTTHPFSKALACAAVTFVLGMLALWFLGGPPADAAHATGYLLGSVTLPAIITGIWSWRSSATWPLWRTVVTYLAILMVSSVLQGIGRQVTSAAVDDATLKAELIAGMRKGYAESARQLDAPSLFDTLEARFPEDFNAFVEKFVALRKARKPIDPVVARTEVADLLVRIQSRDGERVRSAPTANLRAVVTAQRDLAAVLKQEKPELCIAMVTQAQAQESPSTGIARGSIIRLNALLQAIADGRDKPVAARAAIEDADYLALARNAKSRGVDVGRWSVLTPESARTAAPLAVCDALLSSFDAILSEPGALGERILADQVVDLLIVNRDVYGAALKK